MTLPTPEECEKQWLNYTETEYYNRIFQIIQRGCTEAEADMILANVFNSGYISGKNETARISGNDP